MTKRLLATNSLIGVPSALVPQAIVNGAAANGPAIDLDAARQARGQEGARFREDVALDFAAFDSSIARIQFLLASNERERDRYAAEKVKILEASETVRDSTVQLHTQLQEARRTLDVRKKWDELTEKITSNRMLRPREDQEASLERLQAEIAELERESYEYADTWAERRDQFGRIIKEGMELRRLIRDEKEEVERREGMADGDDGEEGEVGLAEVARARSSAATPKPADAAGGTTPLDPGLGSFLGVSAAPSPSVPELRLPADLSPPGSKTPRSENRPSAEDDEIEEGEDTTMEEQGEIVEDEDHHHHDYSLRVGAGNMSQQGSVYMSVTSDASPEQDGQSKGLQGQSDEAMADGEVNGTGPAEQMDTS